MEKVINTYTNAMPIDVRQKREAILIQRKELSARNQSTGSEVSVKRSNRSQSVDIDYFQLDESDSESASDISETESSETEDELLDIDD